MKIFSLFGNIKIKGCVFCSMILSIALILGRKIVNENSLELSLIDIVEFIIFTFVYIIAFYFVHFILTKDYSNRLINRVSKKIKKKPYKWSLLGFLISWSGHLIIKYPAGNCIDVINQIKMGMGTIPMTSHHPIFHTLVMKWFIKIGILLFDSMNIGIFLFVIVEAVIMALIFSYIIAILSKTRLPDIFLLISLIFFMVSPYIVGYVGQSVKDVLFSAFMVLFMVLVFQYTIKAEGVFGKKWNILLFISTAGSILFRNNGIYVIVPTFLIIFILECKKEKRKKHVVCVLCLLILSVLFPVLLNKSLCKMYNAEEGSIAEALSLPFQQTARSVKYHRDDYSSDDIEVINNILPFDALGKKYNPNISDPVKRMFNRDASMDDLKGYFKVWLKYFFKEPRCYMLATIEQNIYLIYPGFCNYRYYVDDNANISDTHLFKSSERIKKNQKYYLNMMEDFHSLPVFDFINNMAIYTILLLMIIVFALNEKKWDLLTLLIPLVLSVLVVVAAPCIKGHVRYMFPVIWSSPIWISAYRIIGKDKNE